MAQPAQSSRRHCLAICTLLYAMSLYLPVLVLPPLLPRQYHYVSVRGFQCLPAVIMPWWWANVLFVVGLIFLVLGRRTAAHLCGIAATGLALSLTFLVLGFLDSWASGSARAPCAGFPLLPGYFAWLGSMIMLVWFTSEPRPRYTAPPESVGVPSAVITQPITLNAN